MAQGTGFTFILGLGRLPVMRIGAAFDAADEGQAEVFGVGTGKPVARARPKRREWRGVLMDVLGFSSGRSEFDA
ncbi:hypothetical protein DB032_13285 [Chromobacterium sp. Panama]|nr:hypothetical protein DB032_13285 [Chromobacterium sp. Panama]